ncbi:uncharacterized protein LOC109614446 [Musca domestica]|uniref:Uncharacterized protein LOC109614446 n=1 Tax=Musca domestica TaxID=7370 RepID=A0A9J7DK62_MUSDO|nr:uncharacterized protein LOC109614446 [Musca domestica]
MFVNIMKYFVFLVLSVIGPIHAFWWRSSPTEPTSTPAPVMKQIPLTYFRTYTYQPMAGNPLPFPLMSSTDYVTNYAALANNPYFNPMLSLLPQAVGAGAGGLAVPATGENENEIKREGRPGKRYGTVVRSWNGANQIPVATKATAGTTSTTTTTTTTPKPTTTSSTTTSTTTTSTTPTPTTTTTSSATITQAAKTTDSLARNDASSAFIKTDAVVNIEAAYPAFNRKVYTNHFNINYNRPVYPYPEYSIYKPASNLNEENNSGASPGPAIPSGGNIEFVPCMCPVNIQNGFPTGLPITGNPSNSIFLAQGRTNPEVEASLELSATDSSESKSSENIPTEAELPLTNFVEDLQMVDVDEANDADVAAEEATQSITAS